MHASVRLPLQQPQPLQDHRIRRPSQRRCRRALRCCVAYAFNEARNKYYMRITNVLEQQLQATTRQYKFPDKCATLDRPAATIRHRVRGNRAHRLRHIGTCSIAESSVWHIGLHYDAFSVPVKPEDNRRRGGVTCSHLRPRRTRQVLRPSRPALDSTPTQTVVSVYRS